jgi:hypothetical protein
MLYNAAGLRAAFVGSGFFPTGNPSAYTGAGSILLGEGIGLAYSHKWLESAAGVTYRSRLHPSQWRGNDIENNEILASIATGYKTKRWLVGPEVFGTVEAATGKMIIEPLLGVHWSPDPAWSLSAAGGIGMGDTVGVPLWRGALAIEWYWLPREPEPKVEAAPVAPPPVVVEAKPVEQETKVEVATKPVEAPVVEKQEPKDESPVMKFKGRQIEDDPKTHALAERLLDTLNKHPEILKIEIVSTMFRRSKDTEPGRILAAWLVKKGIDPTRVKTRRIHTRGKASMKMEVKVVSIKK